MSKGDPTHELSENGTNTTPTKKPSKKAQVDSKKKSEDSTPPKNKESIQKEKKPNNINTDSRKGILENDYPVFVKALFGTVKLQNHRKIYSWFILSIALVSLIILVIFSFSLYKTLTSEGRIIEIEVLSNVFFIVLSSTIFFPLILNKERLETSQVFLKNLQSIFLILIFTLLVHKDVIHHFRSVFLDEKTVEISGTVKEWDNYDKKFKPFQEKIELYVIWVGEDRIDTLNFINGEKVPKKISWSTEKAHIYFRKEGYKKYVDSYLDEVEIDEKILKVDILLRKEVDIPKSEKKENATD